MYISRPIRLPSVSDEALDLELHQQPKYITFLPHSGLQNQRLAYINAMILALATKRTLIMPEVNLGSGTYWNSFAELEHRVDECPRHRQPGKVPGCFDYRHYVPRAVEDVFDLSALGELGVHVLQRGDMGPDYFERELGIRDVYYVNDTRRYTYQIHDAAKTALYGKYSTRIDLDALIARNETLLFFGSLFGTDRLKLTRRPLVKARRELWQRVGPSNAGVRMAAEYVVQQLGGPRQFTSVHLRLGDGAFRARANATQAEIRHKLEQRDQQDGWAYQYEQDGIAQRLMTVRDTHGPAKLLEACVALHHRQQQQQSTSSSSSSSIRDPRFRLIYLATDIHPESLANLGNFICIFTLRDFVQQIKHLIQEPLLIPLVDAEVAAQAAFFIPTPNSTFSSYISHRHLHYS
ncbi:hypothetical protein BX666DRAFT_1865653 [Dichotomocladium elegans]|nr:hypothetical protein BX666DRAFT_1865653 [Dichotomocladium elegans]